MSHLRRWWRTLSETLQGVLLCGVVVGWPCWALFHIIVLLDFGRGGAM